MEQRDHSTDLTDAEWAILAPHLPLASPCGRPPVHSYRVLLNAIFHLLRSSCVWRLLSNELPPWRTVYTLFHSPYSVGRKRHWALLQVTQKTVSRNRASASRAFAPIVLVSGACFAALSWSEHTISPEM